MRANGKASKRLPDRALWRQIRLTDSTEDEATVLLDLAAFADDALDPDERERVAERLARDPRAAADVAAARAVGAAVAPFAPASDAVVARACALVPGGGLQADNVVAFPAWRREGPRLRGMAQWGSLAAAVAVAGWLGFTLGIDASRALTFNDRPAAAGFFNDVLDAQTPLVGDLGDGSQT